MKCAFYTKQGKAEEVLQIGHLDEVIPDRGEVQIQIEYSGVNPGEVKKRSDAFGVGMPYDTIIPHSDGAGVVTKIGEDVDQSWLGKRVLCFGAQSYRQFGTAAEYCCVPMTNIIELQDNVDIKQAAQMGIPGITAHRCIHVGADRVRKDRKGQVVLIHGANGAVGICAIEMAKRAGAIVIGTIRKESDREHLKSTGIQKVYVLGPEIKDQILLDFPDGIDHIVEVAFEANIELNSAIIKQGGSIAAYATNANPTTIPFWPLVFSNVTIYFLGSDDFPLEAKKAASEDLVTALATGWSGMAIGRVYDLEQIAEAHIHVEQRIPGRALLRIR